MDWVVEQGEWFLFPRGRGCTRDWSISSGRHALLLNELVIRWRSMESCN
jgi:hypothetical protein